MSEQTNTKPKKKFINFKFGIRKELIKVVVFMAIYMAVMMVAMAIFGKMNGMAFGLAVSGIMMTMSNDYTLEPVKSGVSLVLSNVIMVAMTWLGYAFFPAGTIGYTLMTTGVTLVAFFFAIYLFTSEERSSTYVSLLLPFILMMYYPVYGVDVFIRMAIFAGSSLLGLAINFMMHKGKFRKKIRQTLDGAIQNMEAQCNAVLAKESKEELVKRSVIIEKTLTGIEGAMGTKMSVLSHWQAGHDMIRTLTILKRINKTITKHYIHGNETMTPEMCNMLKDMLASIDKYENDKMTESEIFQQFDDLYHNMHPELDHSEVLASVKEEMDDFIQGEVYHEDKEEKKRTFGEWARGAFNVYNLVFAAKTAIISAAGLFIVSILNMPSPYIFPLYMALIAQPYIELGKEKSKVRFINTIYAVLIILISFSITNNAIVHFAIFAGLTLVGDMFFQFDFMAMVGTMMSATIRVAMDPSVTYSYTIYRFICIAAACILVQVADVLIFSRSIPATLKKQVTLSLTINKKLRAALNNDATTYTMLHDILMEKRKANQRVRATNRYAKNEQITAFLLADEEWINRLTMINHRFQETGMKVGDLRHFVENGETMTNRQKAILVGFQDVLGEIIEAENFAMNMGKEKELVNA